MTIEQERRAQEARNLKENEIFINALAKLRSQALEGMVAADATDANQIRDHQAMVRAIDGLTYAIEVVILEGVKPPANVLP